MAFSLAGNKECIQPIFLHLIGNAKLLALGWFFLSSEIFLFLSKTGLGTFLFDPFPNNAMIHNATEKRLNTLSDKEKESGKTALPWKIMITTRCFFVEFNFSLLLFFFVF